MANFTKKNTKQELINYLTGVDSTSLTEKSLVDRVTYTLKKAKSALHADLLELANEVFDALTPAPMPIEASVKPKLGKKKTETPAPAPEVESEDDDDESDEDESDEEEAPAPKKAPSKGKTQTRKKDESKKAEKPVEKQVETLPAASNVGADRLPAAKMFPDTIEHDDLGKLVSQKDKYTTYADILEALNAEKTLYFAGYWTKRQIKEYQYKDVFAVKAPKGGFPHDLDIAMAVLPCETMERVFCMSRYTEALYRFEGEDFQYVEDTDPRSGDKFRVRVSAGMEFEIYAPADED